MKKIIRVKKPIPLKGITSAADLLKLADRLGILVNQIVSVNEAGSLPEKGSYIILLKDPNSDVGHWCAKYNNCWFDSMGVIPPSSIKCKTWNEVQYQSTYGEYCGNWCLAFLYSKQKNKDILKSFYDLD